MATVWRRAREIARGDVFCHDGKQYEAVEIAYGFGSGGTRRVIYGRRMLVTGAVVGERMEFDPREYVECPG